MRGLDLVFILMLPACRSAPAPASAPPPPPAPVVATPVVPIVVIDLDCEDATEEHADALTAALRARIRDTAPWQLEPQRPSMTTLIPALSCPRPPNAWCLDQIGTHLHVDHYIWGKVTRVPEPDTVVAEIHYWARGAPERVSRETYSSNLTDQNDDALRRIARLLVEQLDSRVYK